MGDLKWTKAEELCVEGRGWDDTKQLFHRLPGRAQSVVREVVWDLSTKPAGLTLRFETDATAIHARWTLGQEPLSANHTPIYAFSGLDLYGRDSGSPWRWAGVSTGMSGKQSECPLTPWGELDGRMREYMVYLPLYNSVESLEIGLPAGASLSRVAARPERAIAVYGTSIVHGAGVSRPGMTHVSILGRRLDYPVLNLGFAGNAKMEPEIAELLAELDPVLFVIDALPNMSADLIDQRARGFIRTIREARPGTPVVLVEDRNYPAGWFTTSAAEENRTRRLAFKRVYGDMLQENPDHLHYIEGDGLLGTDNDGTSDGSHTNDLGASRMADSLEPVLRALLQRH